MSAVQLGRTLDWEGGSLDELLGLLGEQALSAHIQAVRPGSGQPVGEVYVVAGGVSDTVAGERQGDDAQTFLQKLPGLRFRVSPALPNPDGGLTPPGTDEGNLRERPLTKLMRYCEDFALTCALEITRGDQSARISYRRGEIVRTLVDGSESPERLPDVIGWNDGSWRITLPQLTLPRPKKTQRPAGVVGVPESGGTLFGIPAPVIPGITAPPTAAAAPSAPPRAPGMTAPTPVPSAAPAAASAAPPAAAASPFAPVSPAPVPLPGLVTAPSPSGIRLDDVPTTPISRSGPVPPTAAEAARITPAATAPQVVAPPAAAAASAPPADYSRATPPAVPIPGQPTGQIRPHPARPTFTGLPLVVHVVLGVALGAAVVAGYWAYLRYGIQLGIR